VNFYFEYSVIITTNVAAPPEVSDLTAIEVLIEENDTLLDINITWYVPPLDTDVQNITEFLITIDVGDGIPQLKKSIEAVSSSHRSFSFVEQKVNKPLLFKLGLG
jgi:hypothetical protein